MKPDRQRGQSLVEFAFVLPLLLLVMMGTIELTLALYNKAMITNASREGARAGIAYRVDPTTFNYSPLTDAEIANVVSSYLSTWLVTFGPPSPATTSTTRVGTSPGGTLTVSVAYTYRFLVLPNFATGLPATINLSAVTRMRME